LVGSVPVVVVLVVVAVRAGRFAGSTGVTGRLDVWVGAAALMRFEVGRPTGRDDDGGGGDLWEGEVVFVFFVTAEDGDFRAVGPSKDGSSSSLSSSSLSLSSSSSSSLLPSSSLSSSSSFFSTTSRDVLWKIGSYRRNQHGRPNRRPPYHHHRRDWN
jgi:hypothetical protein